MYIYLSILLYEILCIFNLLKTSQRKKWIYYIQIECRINDLDMWPFDLKNVRGIVYGIGCSDIKVYHKNSKAF